jgi:hypothetical protein
LHIANAPRTLGSDVIENDTWALGAAKGNVVRWAGSTMVEVVGVLTAQACEALHMRLSAERDAHQLFVMLDDIHMAATSISMVEAAVRGTAGGGLPAPLKLLVRAPRLRWAQQHCTLMSEHGISCAASRLPARAQRAIDLEPAVS